MVKVKRLFIKKEEIIKESSRSRQEILTFFYKYLEWNMKESKLVLYLIKTWTFTSFWYKFSFYGRICSKIDVIYASLPTNFNWLHMPIHFLILMISGVFKEFPNWKHPHIMKMSVRLSCVTKFANTNSVKSMLFQCIELAEVNSKVLAVFRKVDKSLRKVVKSNKIVEKVGKSSENAVR